MLLMPLWSRKGKDWLCHSTISNSGEPYEAKVSRTDRRGEGAARLLPTPAVADLENGIDMSLVRLGVAVVGYCRNAWLVKLL